MKNLFRVPFMMFSICLVISSCSKDDGEQTFKENEAITANSSDEFNGSGIYARNGELNWDIIGDLINPEMKESEAKKVLEPYTRESITLLRELGNFSNRDLSEMLDIPLSEASRLNSNSITEASDRTQQLVLFGGWKLKEIHSLYEEGNPNESDGEKWVDCFLEATGIAAGVGIINMLGSQALDETVVKAAIKKAVKKIGTRTLGWIGIGIMVGEYIWCMNRAE